MSFLPLRRRLRQLLAVYGLGHCVAIAVATLIVLGCGDYLLRFQDPGVRLMCTGLALAVLAWAGYAYLFRNLAVRVRNVDLAARIQRVFPVFDDRLPSAVEFLQQAKDDPTAGSAALRRAVVVQTAAQAQNVDFRRVLDHGPALRAMLVLLLMCLEAAILLAGNRSACGTALTRLVHPLGTQTWPQATYLGYRRRVEQVARGQTFELEVIDAHGAPLPAEVRIHYRFTGPGGSIVHESQAMRFIGGAMVARRENVTQPFAYRVEGGDDHAQPWIDVAVVEPPVVESLTVRLTPPAYTGWPVGESTGEIRALFGTRLEFRGQSSKPLQSGALVFDGRRLPLVLDDELRFHVPAEGSAELTVTKSLSYWFALTDREGLASTESDHREIRAVPDAPPSVSIEQPAANLFITPAATVPLRVIAKDDLAIHDVSLAYSRSAQPGKESVLPTIYEGPPHAPPSPGLTAGAANPAGENRLVEYRWDLAPLNLHPGEAVTFWAVARDYHPVSTRSEPRRLSVITPDELLERIAGRQALILAELTRVLKMQRESRTQVAALAVRSEELGALQQLDVDHLQAAALGQRQVERTLTNRGEGLPLHVLAVLADLEHNRVDNPDLQRRMQWLLAEIGRIAQLLLAPLDQELTGAIKAAQVQLAAAPAAAASKRAADPLLTGALATAGRQQDQVIAALEAMLKQLGQWDHYRRFHREMLQLVREQEELAQRTAELARDTLTRELRDLPPQQLADLKVRGQEQLELALRLDRLLEDMRQAGAELDQNDPLAADTIRDALDEAQRQAVGAQMRQVHGQIEQNAMGLAIPAQKQIMQTLRELADILGGGRQQELTRLVKKLDEAQGELDTLGRQQGALGGQIEAANQPEELQRLAAPQAALGDDAQRLARRLERLLAERAGKTTRAAGTQMGKAGEAAGQGRGSEAKGQAKEAQRLLRQAAEELRQRRLEAQAALLAEQLARLEDAVKHLHAQQGTLLDETRRLDGQRPQAGDWTPPQEISLADAARRQRLLQNETQQIAQALSGTGAAFRLALAVAARYMDEAAHQLDRRELGPATQAFQQQALQRLALLLKAFETDSPDGQQSEGNSGGQGGQPGKPPGGVQSAAEIKLIKLLQEALNVRTQALSQADPHDGNVRQQYQAIAEEQGSLAELILQMLRPAQAEKNPGGENP